jgi:hypothetical protein
MYAGAPYCTMDLRSLDPDDVSGVQALYPAGNSGPTAPAAPSNLIATDSAVNPTTAIDLLWTDNSSNESGYYVDRSTDGINFARLAQLGTGAVSFTDSALASGGTYYYRVSAYNTGGNSGYSNIASAVTAVTTQATAQAPSAPTAPSPADGATGVGLNVTLSWTSVGAQAYDVSVYVTGSSVPLRSFSNLSVPSVSLSSLASGTSYTWTVVAKNLAGSTAGPQWSFTTKTKSRRK